MFILFTLIHNGWKYRIFYEVYLKFKSYFIIYIMHIINVLGKFITLIKTKIKYTSNLSTILYNYITYTKIYLYLYKSHHKLRYTYYLF